MLGLQRPSYAVLCFLPHIWVAAIKNSPRSHKAARGDFWPVFETGKKRKKKSKGVAFRLSVYNRLRVRRESLGENFMGLVAKPPALM